MPRWPLRSRPAPTRVTLLTRRGCTHCAEVAPMVHRLATEAGVLLDVRDVDAGPAEQRSRYTDRVPVVLLDGVEHASWDIDERALRRALRRGVA